MLNEILGRTMSNEEIAQKRTEYNDMVKTGGLEKIGTANLYRY